MSDYIINQTQVANHVGEYVIMFLVFLAFILFLYFLIIKLLKKYLIHGEVVFGQEYHNLEAQYNDLNNTINDNSVQNIWSIQKDTLAQKKEEAKLKIKEIEPDYKRSKETYEKKYLRPKRVYDKLKSHKEFIICVAFLLMSFSMLVLNIFYSQTDVSSSPYILPEERMYITQDVEIKVFYYSHYKNVDYETINVIVKNVSKQTINSAILTEESNKLSQSFTDLAPGEEKVVVLTSNSMKRLDTDKFKFSVSNINY